jgi:hypothetical protein
MENSSPENAAIQLQENIPLSDQDLQHIQIQQRAITRTIPAVIAGCTLFIMLLLSFFIKEKFATFTYYDYILLICGGLALFGICYLISFIIIATDTFNWKKDRLYGKNKLRSTVINRDETEDGEYLTFRGPNNDKIRIKVSEEDYARYSIGSKIHVTYLKYSKEALEIIELEKE